MRTAEPCGNEWRRDGAAYGRTGERLAKIDEN
jgi:hypothetical protein